MILKQDNLENFIVPIYRSFITKLELDEYGLENFNKGNSLLNKLSLSLIINYFVKNELNLLTGDKIKKSELFEKLSPVNPFQHFISHMLYLLEVNSYISLADEMIYFNKSLLHFKTPDSIIREIADVSPDFLRASKLLNHCIYNYTELFLGRLTHTPILFPNGHTNFVNIHLEKINEKFFKIDTYFKLIINLFSWLTNNYPSIDILEVGSGQGILTWKLIDVLRNRNNYLYHFTDIGRSLISRAKKHAMLNNLDGSMKFSIFDFNLDPELQNIASNNYNVILAFDSIHNAFNINDTICYLKNLLKPGGILIILESINLPQWLHFIWGVTPEWWSKIDRTQGIGPLLSIRQWEKILEKSAFSKLFVFPDKNLQHDPNFVLLFCQK